MKKEVIVIPAKEVAKNVNFTKPKILRVAAYCRVSTDHEEQACSFENQVEYYTGIIAQNPNYEMAGIYADEGISGTNTKHRKGFQQMITDCECGKIDLILTKSVSRFARNTADCLYYSRKLKNINVGICFEKEKIDTRSSSGELLLTILSSLAQEESRNISENTAWGIRSRFQQGIPHINATRLLGYDKDADGNLVINKRQAAIVCRIFQEFLEGRTPNEIARRLNQEQISGVFQEARWSGTTVLRVLKNEKHKGDLLMQKTYTADFLTKRHRVNRGELDQYYIEGNHPAIIEPWVWDAAQMELYRRKEFCERHRIQHYGSCANTPFFSKIFCAKCGAKFYRYKKPRTKEIVWLCNNTQKRQGHSCDANGLSEKSLFLAMKSVYKMIVDASINHYDGWADQIKCGNPLQRLRAMQMQSLFCEGGHTKLRWSDVIRMTLEEIVVGKDGLWIRLLDGSTHKSIIS